MAELILPFVQLFCGIPAAPILVPLIEPLIPFSPINVIAYLAFLFGFYFGPSNSFVNGSNTKSGKSWKTAAYWAFIFYYVSMIIIVFLLVQTGCQVASNIPVIPA